MTSSVEPRGRVGPERPDFPGDGARDTVLVATLCEALHAYRDYLLDLASGSRSAGVVSTEVSRELDLLLRLSATAADGICLTRRSTRIPSRHADHGQEGFESDAFRIADRWTSPWDDLRAYRLARSAVSLELVLRGDPDEDALDVDPMSVGATGDPVLHALLHALHQAEELARAQPAGLSQAVKAQAL